MADSSASIINVETNGDVYVINGSGVHIQVSSGAALAPSGAITGTASGALTGTYPAPILATTAFGVYYLDPSSSLTVIPASVAKFVFGKLISVPFNSATSITNLPFANATSYSISPTFADSEVGIAEAPMALNASGASCTITNTDDGTNRDITYIGVGF